MLYIQKEGLSAELNQKIIEIRKSDDWNSIDEKDTTSVRCVFDNEFPKNSVKEVLIHEQKGLCAYCMKRIRMDIHSRVEHLIPLSEDKEKAIDYNNLLGVCDGGEKSVGQQGHVLCCDARKKERKINISPLNKGQMGKIAYKPDGSVQDTSTEILKGRRDAYDRARRMMENLNKSGKCTSLSVKKIMENLQNKEELEEFVGVKLYYFRKKYDALVRRGL